MRAPTLLFALAAFLLMGAAPAPRLLALAGTLTNTTADASGETTIALTLSEETATATITTSPPLVGTGKLEGKFRQGWLELSGKLDEGFTLQLRGALNSQNYRGTYIAAVPGSPVQYGKFDLVVTRQGPLGK